jgi:hypothetical protein
VTAATSKENEIRASVNQGGGLFGAVMQYLHKASRQTHLGAEPRDQSRCFRCALGALEHHGGITASWKG